MLKRNLYLSRIAPFYDSTSIKFLVGIRSSGKGSIFNQIIEDLKNSNKADSSHIIYINLEFLDNDKIRENTTFINYIKKKITDTKMYYLFLKEIQYLPKFEISLIELLKTYDNISIFASCSNSRILLKNLNSNIRKACKIFYITPLSYVETCKFLNTTPKNRQMLLNYLKYGGFPNRLVCKKSSEVKRYLYSLLDSIFLRDIVMRLGISDIDNMNDITKCVVQHIGKTFHIEDVKKSFAKLDKTISDVQLYNGIDCLSQALLIHGVNNYNVKTNIECHGIARYYIGDLGLRFIYGLDIENNMDAILKNLIWLELKRRGYEVYTGINGDKTFDFVAIRHGKYMYIQVLYLIEDGNTANVEIEKLSNFDFNGKRYILSLDDCDYSRKGVIHKNIIDFILEGEDDIQSPDEPETWIAVE